MYSHIDKYEDPKIPFESYLLQHDEPSSLISVRNLPQSFEAFPKLPFDIKLCIYKQCDPRTLLKLMHVCKDSRDEAEKLFFDKSNTWFFVNADFIVIDLGFPFAEPWSIPFASRATQIEISTWSAYALFVDDRSSNHKDPCRVANRTTWGRLTLEEQTKLFWYRFLSIFPRAKNIVIYERRKKSPGFRFSEQLGAWLKACPSHINIHTLILEEISPKTYERALYRLISSNAVGKEAQWCLVTRPYTRNRICLPNKKFRGPVGRAIGYVENFDSICNRFSAIGSMRREAFEIYLEKNPGTSLKCPFPRCEEEYFVKGEWTKHVKITGHDSARYLRGDGSAPRNWLRVEGIPDAVAEHLRVMEQKTQKLLRDLRIEGIQWQQEADFQPSNGRNKVAEFELKLVHQLKNDMLYYHDCPSASCSILDHLYRSFDFDADWKA